MIRALENNTLGLVLATLCGVFLMLGLGLAVMWAMPPSAGPDDVDETEAEVAAAMAALESTRPFEEYAVIGQRPVFNEDRRPAPVIEVDGDPEPFDPDDVVGAPEVELAGIVITPSLRLATLRSKDQQYSLVAFEGQPLEGDYGSWQVSRIDERMVTLASAEGEEMQLELQIHDAVIAEPPKPERDIAAEPVPEGEEGMEEVDAEPSEAMSRAEEIRQRIEERREELRRAAEERGGDEQAQNYRDAIQSMIQKRNEDRSQQRQTEEDGQ